MRVVQPTVTAVSWCLKLGCSLEVERGLAFSILTITDDAAIAHVDVDAVVRLDAVDGLQFRTVVGIGQLIVGPSVQDGTLQQWSFKGSASNGNHRASSVLGVLDAVRLA